MTMKDDVEKCSWHECEAPGIWYPKILVCHKSDPSQTIEVEVRLPLCPLHKAETKVSDLATPNFYETVDRLMDRLGHHRPTRELTQLGWTRELSLIIPKQQAPS